MVATTMGNACPYNGVRFSVLVEWSIRMIYAKTMKKYINLLHSFCHTSTLRDACDCRLPKPAYWTVFRNHIDLFRLLLLSNASAARHHLSNYVQLFDGDSQAMMSSQHSDPLLQEINEVLSTPRELRDLCRLAIRSHLAYTARGSGIVRLVSQLPLPRSLINYLRYVQEIKTEREDGEDDDDITISFRKL